jgi:hypothetical protein
MTRVLSNDDVSAEAKPLPLLPQPAQQPTVAACAARALLEVVGRAAGTMAFALRPLSAPGSAARRVHAAARVRPALSRAVGRARPAARRVLASAAPDGSKPPEGTASKTLSNLDAVLGVQDEPAEAQAKQVRRDSASESPTPRVCFLYLLFWPVRFKAARAPAHCAWYAGRTCWHQS